MLHDPNSSLKEGDFKEPGSFPTHERNLNNVSDPLNIYKNNNKTGVEESLASPGASSLDAAAILNSPIEKRHGKLARTSHPNIQHHKPIHPHTNYQRVTTPTQSPKIMTNAMDFTSAISCVTQNGPVVTDNKLSNTNFIQQNELDIIDLKTLQRNNSIESNELKNDIKQLQDLIDKLNFEIFKNPRNYTRPPSEYLEIYNTFTEQLHNLQVRKQTIDSELQLNENDNEKNNLLERSNTSESLGKNTTKNDKDIILKSSSKSVDLDMLISNSLVNEPNISKMNSRSEYFDNRKPPQPPKVNSSNLPKFKLDHPTTLQTQSVNSPATKNCPQIISSPSFSQRSGSRNGSTTQFYISNSLQGSPATTPNLSNAGGGVPVDSSSNQIINRIQGYPSNTEKNRSDQSSSPPGDHLCSSLTNNNGSLIPLSPLYSTNQNNNSNHSRSFGDINEAIINNQSGGLNTNPSTPNFYTSISPSSSMATTPTLMNYGTNLSSSFLRIYIGSSTAVVEKKCIPLKEALYSKLKSRSLEIDKCIAYIKDSNIKIDWDMEVSRIVADNIVVAELSDEIQHSFEKKTFTFRSCDWCKKRFVLNAYACTKCDYIMCQRNECRSKSELTVCVPRRFFNMHNASSLSSGGTTSVMLAKPENLIELGRPDSPIKSENATINISQQILPVNQLKVSIPSRDRSRSETELNMFGNIAKLKDNVQKSPSERLTSNSNSIKDSLYGTLPHKFPIKNSQNPQSDNVSQISGSINEESGSVISSLCTSKSTEKISNTDQTSNIVNFRNSPAKKGTTALNKLHKPSRRDSFNAWEIPFKQIKIDMNRKVGSGSFGIVHQGKDFYHGIVAIKFLNVQNPTPHQSHAFRNEVAILKSTRHDNVLLFIGCILKPYLAIVTEWCPGSSLYKHIHVEEERWEMNQLVDIAKQTATGMEYLHARDILHRDMKSNNIFLNPKNNSRYNQYYQNGKYQNGKSNTPENSDDMWTVKIGDFGLATVKSTWTQTSAKTNQPTGSILWMAPEVIQQKVDDPYTHKSDVYSFAVVLYELVTGHLPYVKKEQNMILFLVGSGRLKLNVEDARNDTPDGIKDLLKICSEYDRNKRLEFVEINEWFKKILPVKLKSKIQRAQSVPNLGYSYDEDRSYLSSFGMYEEEIYPQTPDLDSLNSYSIKNNTNDSNSNLSQLITNM